MSFLRTASQATQSLRGGLLRQSALSQPALFHTTATRWLSAEARKKIDDAVKKDPLVVFMKGTPELPMCGFSRAVCQILDVQGVKADKLKTYNCLDDQELREGIKEYSSWPTIPQVYVNGEFTGGCDIMLSMHQSGELEQLLQGAGLVDIPPKASAETGTGP
ncbi:glutaredoxin [Acaromyces ingoldii]|uniref:Monothiol glutaredoxin-5, mitochondrial n=1 Tax=Acaromyces ingoldii TaxID=215250 RepID=A0A316YN75_9BASI|nr:glutaredoxin [Acaromyces ingoldii]PWN90264.1 glutaredoxin [Acaromyces ingoldii]